LKKKILQTSFT